MYLYFLWFDMKLRLEFDCESLAQNEIASNQNNRNMIAMIDISLHFERFDHISGERLPFSFLKICDNVLYENSVKPTNKQQKE